MQSSAPNEVEEELAREAQARSEKRERLEGELAAVDLAIAEISEQKRNKSRAKQLFEYQTKRGYILHDLHVLKHGRSRY